MDKLLRCHASLHFASCTTSYGSYVVLYNRSRGASGRGTDGASTSGANTELIEGKPWCIPSIFLDFCFKLVFVLQLFVH
jgi:hypothetical protein